MYVTVVPNRKSPPATLLRESYREEGKVKNRTVANISDWPPEQVEALRAVLKGDLTGVGPMPEVEASLPHGHVAAVLGTARHLGMEKLLSNKWGRERDLVMALVCGRVLAPSSKLALAQALQPGSAHHTLGQELGVEGATEDELYWAMDWLLERQEKIEAALAKKHLSNGCTVLYDLSSSYFEGTTCPLAKFGYSRDHRGDRLPWGTHAFPRILRQVNYGLLCNGEGIPVAIEVVEGNTGDPETIPAPRDAHARPGIYGQVAKLKERFGLSHVVVVGDRGMVTTTQIEGAIEPGGFGWISALKHGAVEKLALAKVIQPSLFDETGIAEISHASFPGERLVACMNPFMKTKREKVRENLLSLTEKELAKVAAACVRERKPLDGRDQVGLAAGRVVNRFGMAKYFRLHVGDHSLRYARRAEVIAREAATDGIYVIRTSEPTEAFTAEKAVETYKSLAKVERVFRCMKGVDLPPSTHALTGIYGQVRPIHHHLADRVKAHLFLCMLAYYLEWHLRQAWAGLLFHDEEGGTRTTPVAPVEPSEAAKTKKRSPRTNPDLPLQTYRGLIQSLAALSRSIIRLGSSTYTRCAKATPLQAEAFKRLGLALP